VRGDARVPSGREQAQVTLADHRPLIHPSSDETRALYDLKPLQVEFSTAGSDERHGTSKLTTPVMSASA